MKNCIFTILALVWLLAGAAPAQATCYADYKAKRDTPLRLHYGVAQISDAACNDRKRARVELARRLSSNEWQLLNIVSVFDDSGLNERQKSAGKYFLRY